MDDILKMLERVDKQRNRVIIFNERCLEQFKGNIENNGIKLTDFSFKLAELLSSFTNEKKSHESWDTFVDWMESRNDNVLAFYNIDYIFSPEVGNLDPIENFNYYSRSKQRIILFIRAKRYSNHLEYSEEGKSDYNRMDISKNEYVLGWEDED